MIFTSNRPGRRVDVGCRILPISLSSMEYVTPSRYLFQRHVYISLCITLSNVKSALTCLCIITILYMPRTMRFILIQALRMRLCYNTTKLPRESRQGARQKSSTVPATHAQNTSPHCTRRSIRTQQICPRQSLNARAPSRDPFAWPARRTPKQSPALRLERGLGWYPVQLDTSWCFQSVARFDMVYRSIMDVRRLSNSTSCLPVPFCIQTLRPLHPKLQGRPNRPSHSAGRTAGEVRREDCPKDASPAASHS